MAESILQLNFGLDIFWVCGNGTGTGTGTGAELNKVEWHLVWAELSNSRVGLGLG